MRMLRCFIYKTEKKKGRFDVMVEDGDEVLVGASGVSQTNVSAHHVFGLMLLVLYKIHVINYHVC